MQECVMGTRRSTRSRTEPDRLAPLVRTDLEDNL